MKIFTGNNAARCLWCQLPRIEKGFIELGHEITPYISEADLIYCNNPPYHQEIKDKINGIVKGKMIFNVLDIPEHIKNFNVDDLKDQLQYAHSVTSISNYTKKCVKKYCGINSDVIYNPIMPIFPVESKFKKYKYLFIGRVRDANKRNYLGIEALT